MATIPMTPVRGVAKRSALPMRGVVVAAIAVGLGACLMRPAAGVVPWGDLAILGSLAVASLVGARQAQRLASARAPIAEAVPEPVGTWMRVVVGEAGPADAAGMVVVPQSPPRDDPERRSLVRRARERRRAGSSRR